MRIEKEMMGLILRTAEEDARIRAIYMNGSRTNPNAPKDIFQDYDIVYVVEETGPFIRDKEWIRRHRCKRYVERRGIYVPAVHRCVKMGG
ncbi:MAG: aminoglycoside 6-adenylyltransferase [Lachnospiraceae bacterium]|nr:aminoglycoside 6-adenylyltransferase [Lachnospiraceae bacterium]